MNYYYFFSLLQKLKDLVYDLTMPRKTLALIVGLVLVTIILFIIALRTGQDAGKTGDGTTMQPSPTPHVVSVLMLDPNPVAVVSGKQGEVNVILTPSYNKVTAVQLEIQYDPLMVSDVEVEPGPLFPNAVVLINTNDVETGTITYAFGISPSQKPVVTAGLVAKLTFTARGVIGKQSQIIIQPTSLVTAQGVADSVLSSATGTTVVIGSATTTDVMENVTPTSSVQGAKARLTPTPTKALVTPTKPVFPKTSTTPAVPPPAN